MKRALLFLFLLAVLSAPALAAGPVAKVNGKAIPANRAEVLVAHQLAQGQADSPELRANVREELVRREILTQAAVKKGFDKRADVRGQLELARQGVLIGAYLNDYVRNLKIGEEQLRKEYDAIRAARGDKEYKARHILVETEGEAKEIIAKLKKGESFDALAKASKDPGTRERGGELGWANKANYVPAFAEAMIRLAKGQTTEVPVNSDFGWHVIRLDDLRELPPPPFDEVKPQIEQRMRQQAVEQHVLDLRAKAKVE